MKTVIIILCSLLGLSGVGCIAISKLITPADLNTKAVEYVISAEVAEPNDFVGYPNLAKLEKLQQDIDIAYTVTQFDLQQQADRNDLDYNICKGTVDRDLEIANQREELLFGESGLLSLGLGLAGFGGLTGYIGLMRKRPGDVTPQEKEQLLADVKGKSVEELTQKEKQLVQLVTGAQKFIETFGGVNPEAAASLKMCMNESQDTDTKIAVASIKATA